MAHKRLKLISFAGGLSDDDRTGPRYSASVADQIDARRGQNVLTLKQALRRESGVVVDTEVTDAVRCDAGNVYAAGTTKIYKRAPGTDGSAGTWSVDSANAALIGVRDLDWRPDLDSLFLYDQNTIHEKAGVSGGGTYSYNKYGAYDAFTQHNGVTTAAYTLPAAIAETDANKLTFTCTGEPLESVTFNVDAKGASGDWILTLHDGANRVVATVTIPYAQVPAAGTDITFTFASPVRLKLGLTYHMHLTVTAGVHAVHTQTIADLSTADCSTKASRLVNTGKIGHATMQYGPVTLFCNGQYLGQWDILDTTDNATSGFDPHRLIFPSEVDTLNIALYSEYVAISAQIDDSTDLGTNRISKGIIFFWDGISDFYNFAIDVPQGVPHGLFAFNNMLYFEAGGRWCRWAGGEVEVIFEFPTNELSDTDVLPALQVNYPAARKAMAVRDNQLVLGWPESITDIDAEPYFGLFSYGTHKQAIPKSFGFDSYISTHAASPTIIGGMSSGITLVRNLGNNLLVAWRDEVTPGVMGYGIDYVNETAPAADQGLWLSLWFDNGDPDKEKTARAIKIVFDTLPEGVSVQPIYQNDRDDSLEYGPLITEGAIEAIMPLNKNRFYSCRFGFSLSSVAGHFPRIRSLTFKYDDNYQETNDTEVRRGG